MYILNAFANIPDLSDNIKGVVATFGEISTRSLTYSKDTRNYSNTTVFPNVELITFSSYANDGKPVDPNIYATNSALAVASWLYDEHCKDAIPTNTSKQSLESSIEESFSSYKINDKVVTIRNVSIGEILVSDQTGRRLVDYVIYDCVIDTQEYRIKVWFCDKRFQTQYAQYEIVVIPPVPVIDSLIGSTADVANDLNSITKSAALLQVANVTSQYKQTDIYPYELKWHDLNNANATLKTEWVVVIYGAAGNDTDAIKDAIRLYISEHSNKTVWNQVFPDLYSESEFILVPFWDQLSTPTGGLDDGLYSSSVVLSEINRLTDKYIPRSYGSSTDLTKFKTANLSVCASSYRDMMFMALGNPNNKENHYQLKQRFPDYMGINTDNVDFARLTQDTQRFVIKLNEAFNKARLFTPNDPIPKGYTRVSKGNRECLGFDYNGFTYLVMTRFGFNHD